MKSVDRVWSEDDEAELRRFWEDEKLTAAQIGERTGRSRGAITGKVRRLNLSSRPKPIPAPRRVGLDFAIELVAEEGMTLDEAARKSNTPFDRVANRFTALRAQYDYGVPAGCCCFNTRHGWPAEGDDGRYPVSLIQARASSFS